MNRTNAYGGRLYGYGDGKEDIYDKSAKVGNKTYPARTMIINGKETPVFLADDNRMYAVGDDKTPFEIWSQYSLPEVTVTPSKNKDKITGDYYNNSANRYYDSSYDPNGFMDFMNAATLGLGNRLSVSQNARLVKDIYDATTGNKSWEDVVNSAVLGNNGIFVNPYANMALDIVVPTVGGKYRSIANVGKGIANTTAKGVQEVSYALGRYAPSNVKDFIRGKIISKELDKLNPRPNISTPTPIIRTKAGDVEVDDPNLFYHLDRGDSDGAFSSNGAHVDNGMLYPGKSKDVSQTSYSWWNKGKPYAYSVGEEPLTRMVTSSENPSLIKVRDQNYPIGQWNGKSGFVLNSEYVSSSPIDVSNSTYVFDPSYGWRKSDLSSSTIDWNNAVFAHNFAHAYGGRPLYFQGAFKDGKDMIYNYNPYTGEYENDSSIDDSLYDPTKNVLDEVVIKPDKYTKQLTNLMHTDFPDKNVRDYIYKVADRYTNMSLSTYNDVLARTLAMYDLGGKPSISVTPKYERYRTKRGLIANKSTLNPITKALGIRYVSKYNPLSNHINIIGDSPNDFEQEISHGILRNYLGPFMALRTKKDSLQGFINASIKGGFPYYTPGYTEYNAHHLILPNVFKYITTGNKNYIKYIRSGVYGKETK